MKKKFYWVDEKNVGGGIVSSHFLYSNKKKAKAMGYDFLAIVDVRTRQNPYISFEVQDHHTVKEVARKLKVLGY